MQNTIKQKAGIIVVAHNCPDQLRRFLKSLENQLNKEDEVVIVDNHIAHKSSRVAKEFKFVSKILEIENKGFANGCNIGVKALSKKIDIILFLNPDTFLEKKCLELLLKDIPEHWAAWMPLLIKPDGKVNSAGNSVHISGLSWCYGYNKNPKNYKQISEIKSISGACLVIKKSVYDAVGGMPETYFLYYEDTALSSILTLKGYKLGLVGPAHIYHDYEFYKSKNKWFYIERNRYVYILSCWPSIIIFFLLPYLMCIEIGLWLISIIEKRFILKISSTISFLRMLPQVMEQRQVVQNNKKVDSYIFFKSLESQIKTEQLGDVKKFTVINSLSRSYYLFVAKLLSVFS